MQPDCSSPSPILVRKWTRPTAPLLSVLVRCYNEIGALPGFWESLRQQTVFEQLEIVVLDSGSTDGSLDYMLTQPCSIYQIPSSSFNFGRSCNQLMQLSSAPLAMFLSAHVFLEQSNAVEQVIGLLHPGDLRAAYFRQVPNAILGFNAYEAGFLKRRFPSGDKPQSMRKPGAFSNAASVLTREAWLRLQFPEIHGSEDHRWAEKFLDLGGEMFYLPQLQVQHSHNENPGQVFQRVRLNVLARGNAGSYFRAIYLFAGIVAQTLRVGGSPKEAVQFAWNHARAYL